MRKNLLKGFTPHITKNYVRGFTLIELIMAMGIFIFIVLIISGVFVTSLRSQRKNTAFQEIQENGRYILEMMMKEIRMSKINTDFGTFENLNIERNDTGANVFYYFDNNQIYREETNPQTGEVVSLPINSDLVKVNHLKFYVSNLLPQYQETGYHRVTVVMELESQRDPNSKIDLQTTVVSRPPPCPTGICSEL